MIKQMLQAIAFVLIGFIAVTIMPPLIIAIAYITMYAFAFATLLLVVAVVCATLYKLYKQISDRLR